MLVISLRFGQPAPGPAESATSSLISDCSPDQIRSEAAFRGRATKGQNASPPDVASRRLSAATPFSER